MTLLLAVMDRTISDDPDDLDDKRCLFPLFPTHVFTTPSSLSSSTPGFYSRDNYPPASAG